MSSMRLKPQYKKSEERKKTYMDLQPFLREIVTFKKNESNSNVDFFNKFMKKIFSDDRVWILFGKDDESNEWEALQVAQTKENIKIEIIEAIQYLFSDAYAKLTSVNAKFIHTQFYSNSYAIPSETPRGSYNEVKRKYQYSKMGNDYGEFKICVLEYMQYLQIPGEKFDNDSLKDIVAIAAPCYAEAKLAYDTLAKYWNAYKGGVDGQAIALFQERGHM